MKIKLTVAMLIALINIGASEVKTEEKPVSINFYHGTYAQAIAEAKKQNKPIFIDAFTSWCGPCKLLSKNTFTDKEVAAYYNEHFINLSVDMEKGEGPTLAAKYKVTHYPTLIITDDSGNRITFTVGYILPEDMLGFGKFGVSKTPDASAKK